MLSPRFTVEGLANELKMQILRELPDVATLTSLKQASPSYRALFKSASEEILTTVTLNELAQRGICFGKACDFAYFSDETGKCE